MAAARAGRGRADGRWRTGPGRRRAVNIRLLAAAAGVVAVTVGLSGCGGTGHTGASVVEPAPAPTTAAPTPEPSGPDVLGTVPKVPPAPAVSVAQARVARALVSLESAAGVVL